MVKMFIRFSSIKVINDFFKSYCSEVMRVEVNMVEWVEEKVGGEEVEGNL